MTDNRFKIIAEIKFERINGDASRRVDYWRVVWSAKLREQLSTADID